MLNSDMLEVATGLIFVYLLFSFLTTSAREGLEGYFKRRADLLEQGICALLTEPAYQPDQAGAPLAFRQALSQDEANERAIAILDRLYCSSPVFGLFRGSYTPPASKTLFRKGGRGKKLPSYIPADAFSAGLLEVVQGYGSPKSGGSPGTLDRLRLAVEAVPNSTVRNMVRNALKQGDGDPAAVRRYLELWFAGAMDRVAGQYRRETQFIVLAFSFVVACGLNINTITIVQALSQNAPLREAVAHQADIAVAGQGPLPTARLGESPQRGPGDAETERHAASDTPDAAVAKAVAVVRSYGLPVGWDPSVVARFPNPNSGGKPTPWSKLLVGWIVIVAGWVMTALAISLGAPFWFDVLNKFMIVRATVKPDEKSGKEGSKDPPAMPAASTASAVAPGPAAGAAGAPGSSEPSPDPILVEADPDIAALDPAERPREEDI